MAANEFSSFEEQSEATYPSVSSRTAPPLAAPGDAMATSVGQTQPVGATDVTSQGTDSGSGPLSAGQPIVSLVTLATYLSTDDWGGVNWRWGSTTITYNISALTPAEQNLARQAFHAWSSVANLTFVEVAGGGNITFSHASTGAYAGFSGSNGIITSASVNIGTAWMASYYDAAKPYYNYAFQTYLHEIGHALGLGHQGNYNGTADYGVDNNFANDSWQFSIMSYFTQDEYNYNGAGSSFAYVSGPMQADIIALRQKYGTRSDSTIYVYGDSATRGAEYDFANGVRAFTMYGASGFADLYSTSYAGSQTIDMRAGGFSSVRGLTNNIGLADQTNMRVYSGGSGTDVVLMSQYGSYVAGNVGNDVFRSHGSASGANYVDGGSGNDTYQLLAQSTYVVFQRASQSSNGWNIYGASLSDHVYNVETASFTNGTVTLRQSRSNFNFSSTTNDTGATSDLLLTDAAGNVYAWTMQSSSVATGVYLGTFTGGTVVATGDFDANGSADILIRSGNSLTAFMVGVNTFISSSLVTTDAASWRLVGTGDLNNNGSTDIVIQNGASIAAWLMTGGVPSGTLIGTAVGYTAVGVADINGNGSSDVLLQDGNNNLYAWLLGSSAQILSGVYIGNIAGYTIAGTADFNNDGQTDILLISNAGQVYDLIMANGAVARANYLGTTAGASLVGTGDYNGDGTADLAWQSGATTSIWTISAGTLASTSAVASTSGFTLFG